MREPTSQAGFLGRGAEDGPIGVFDSGVGGLTVVRELFRQLPAESVRYLGDTAHCPYGDRPAAEVRRLTCAAVRFLCRKPLKALLIACNTATALVPLARLQQQATIPVLGVILPGAYAAVRATRKGRIGVIGTVGTIQSAAYEQVLLALQPSLHVSSLACPPFVPLVEENRHHSPFAAQVVANQLQPLLAHDLDTLVLGCTHYPLLEVLIRRTMGPGVTLISSAAAIAAELKICLRGRLAPPTTRPQHTFFATGDRALFRQVAATWLEQSIAIVKPRCLTCE